MIFLELSIIADSAIGLSFGATAGMVQRIRGDTLTDYCGSPTGSLDPTFWDIPTQPTVGSQGRVVSLASIVNTGRFHTALMRCNAACRKN